MKMTTTKKTSIQKPTTNKGPMMYLGNLAMKSVMLADLGDGAFTDSSIKIKPHKNGVGIVLKCTDKGRLLAGLVQAGLNPAFVKIVKGRKHYVAILSKAPMISQLPSGGMKALKG